MSGWTAVWMIPAVFLPLWFLGWRVWVLEDRVKKLEGKKPQ